MQYLRFGAKLVGDFAYSTWKSPFNPNREEGHLVDLDCAHVEKFALQGATGLVFSKHGVVSSTR